MESHWLYLHIHPESSPFSSCTPSLSWATSQLPVGLPASVLVLCSLFSSQQLHLTQFLSPLPSEPPVSPCSPRSKSGFPTMAPWPPTRRCTSNPCFLSGLLLPFPVLACSVSATLASLPVLHTTGRLLPQGLCTCCFFHLGHCYPRNPGAHFPVLSGLCCSDVPSLERPSLTTPMVEELPLRLSFAHPALVFLHSTSFQLPFCPVTHGVWSHFPSPSLIHMLRKGRGLRIFPGNFPGAQNGGWHAVDASELLSRMTVEMSS